MKVIYKYLLNTDYPCLPKDAEIISVGVQNDELFAWALVDKAKLYLSTPHVPTFRVAGTGHFVSADDTKGKFWGTFILEDGYLVFHVWQLTSPQR